MEKQIGLWIDHREAIVVIITGGVQEIKHIASNSKNHMDHSTPKSLKGSIKAKPEDQKDRKSQNILNSYYDEVIGIIRDATSIKIFGPGEAKGELEKRIEHNGVKVHLFEIETVDKMTENQISAKVREFYST